MEKGPIARGSSSAEHATVRNRATERPDTQRAGAPRRLTALGAARALRLVTFGALATLAFVPTFGLPLQQLAFAVMLASSAARVLLAEHPPTFAAFEAGIALIVFGDSLAGHFDIIGVSDVATDTARRYYVAAASVAVLGYELIGQGSRPSDRRPRHTRGRVKPLAKDATLVLLVLLNIYVFARYGTAALDAARGGRIGAESANQAGGALSSVAAPLSRSLSIALPALWLWWLGPKRRPLALIISLPTLAVLLPTGTRFYLLAAVAGILLSLQPSRASFRTAAAAAVLVLLATSWISTATRGDGLLAGDAGERLVESEVRLAGGEGVLRTVAQMDAYHLQDAPTGGQQLGALALFWVPRSFWEDKPELLGYWFPREYGLTGFSEGHSVSAGFAGELFMDFGFVGGALGASIIGAGLRLADRRLLQQVSGQGTIAVAYGCFLGLAFLASRSLGTALIMAIGVLVVVSGVTVIGTASSDHSANERKHKS